MIELIKEKAILDFMINTLRAVFPHHYEYPYQELKEIEEAEGNCNDMHQY